MSYDVTIIVPDDHECNCDRCEPRDESLFWGNYTSNVSPMWSKAGISLKELDGTSAGDAVEPLRAAVALSKKHPAMFEAMNPPNGWGDSASAFKFLQEIAYACEQHPDARIEVSW